jgi:pimeloyl-ACP methyl ester carboxylesterase
MSQQLDEGAVRSADGTQIGFLKVGSGSSIVFVHGSLATGEQWLPVANGLAESFTCYLMDRRGRGRSGDAEVYSLRKECEDIKAVLDAAGSDACLVGHSYGAICALETANTFPVARLVLYEPPLPIRHSVIGPAFNDLRAAVAKNDLSAALTIGLRDMVKVAAAELEGLKASPAWSPMAALTPTWVRECEVIAGLELGVERFADMASPTLLLLGTATAAHHIEASRALEATLPVVRCTELEGESHFAHLTATDRVVSAVRRFAGEA